MQRRSQAARGVLAAAPRAGRAAGGGAVDGEGQWVWPPIMVATAPTRLANEALPKIRLRSELFG